MIQTSEKPSTSAAADASTEPGKPYVRLARPEDYPQIEKMARRAFINDPMPMYLAANPSVSRIPAVLNSTLVLLVHFTGI